MRFNLFLKTHLGSEKGRIRLGKGTSFVKKNKKIKKKDGFVGKSNEASLFNYFWSFNLYFHLREDQTKLRR